MILDWLDDEVFYETGKAWRTSMDNRKWFYTWTSCVRYFTYERKSQQG